MYITIQKDELQLYRSAPIFFQIYITSVIVYCLDLLYSDK